MYIRICLYIVVSDVEDKAKTHHYQMCEKHMYTLPPWGGWGWIKNERAKPSRLEAHCKRWEVKLFHNSFRILFYVSSRFVFQPTYGGCRAVRLYIFIFCILLLALILMTSQKMWSTLRVPCEWIICQYVYMHVCTHVWMYVCMCIYS